MTKLFNEITPLSAQDCFYLVDRLKNGFDFPVHCHKEFELNLIINCEGCQRIVGDSIEEIGYYDLAIVGTDLEHGWLQNGVTQSGKMREITIQWDPSLFDAQMLEKNQFTPIKTLLKKASHGIAFDQKVILELLPKFEALVNPQSGFLRYLRFLEILYMLSISDSSHTLSTTSFANLKVSESSRRIKKVKDYIAAHYAEEINLEQLASIAGMSATAFSRFFKTATNQTLSGHIITTRLGHAVRYLVDTNMTSAEICYKCGFNNLSNFNRLFKKNKGCTPLEFRLKYTKTKIII